MMTKKGPRILYFSIGGPSAKTPPIATAAPSAARTKAKSRGAVPGPKAKPRCPGSSEAQTRNVSGAYVQEFADATVV